MKGSQVDISLENQTVMATIDNKTYALRASDETTLVIMPLEKPIRFFIDEKNDCMGTIYWAKNAGEE